MTDVALLAGMGLDASDLTVLGVQEVENLKPRRHEGSRSREWRRLVLKALGRTHALLSLTSLGGLQLAVLAKYVGRAFFVCHGVVCHIPSESRARLTNIRLDRRFNPQRHTPIPIPIPITTPRPDPTRQEVPRPLPLPPAHLRGALRRRQRPPQQGRAGGALPGGRLPWAKGAAAAEGRRKGKQIEHGHVVFVRERALGRAPAQGGGAERRRRPRHDGDAGGRLRGWLVGWLVG